MGINKIMNEMAISNEFIHQCGIVACLRGLTQIDEIPKAVLIAERAIHADFKPPFEASSETANRLFCK